MLAELPLATTQRWPEWIVSSRPSQSVIAPPALRTIGGTIVSPGDLLIGDDDGLVALTPATIRSRIADAEARLVLEAKWEEALKAGQTAQAVFGLTPA